MGIKNLHKILERYAPDVYKYKHLSEFAYKKVAIDVSLYLYKFKATLGEKWLEGFLNMVVCLRRWDVHCFFIYDGIAPIEKREEQMRRRQSSVNQKERVALLEEEIKLYESSNLPGQNMIEICKKYGGPVSLFKKNNDATPKINLEIVKNRLEELKSMIILVTEDDIKISKELFDILKTPYIVAPDEAERYASYLCVHKKVDAVLSEDTDVLCYKTPLFLTKIDIYKNTIISIEFTDILKELEIESSSFIDLCIMLGCDYNSNIENYGMIKSFDLIKKFKSIEKCIEEIKKIKENLNSDILNHKRCRELFSVPETLDFYVPYCGTPDFDKLSEFLFQNQLKANFNTIKESLGHRTLVFEENQL
jgi:flap endonuclease-1